MSTFLTLFLCFLFSCSEALNFANTKECGIYSDGDAERDSRIVGGVDARPGSFPYLVSIKYKPKNKHICGGSLISENFVLTAAHCLSYLNKTSEQLVVAGKNQFAVEVGEYSLKEDEPWSETKLVEEIILHPDYNHRSFQHDIALLKLSTPVEFKANWTEVGPACVCNPGEVTGDVTIAGWGRLEQDGNPPDIIQTASIPIVQHGRCKRMMRLKGLRVSNTEICAGEKGRSVCKGDSGGPLIKTKDGVDYVCGIVSWGVGCAKKLPAVFTEVSKYIEWMQQIME